ncbi:uncharacterized protein B0T15DRAFT_4160 [Chaetomium strumarium]|uniref:C2H2-type domain-containing protein n=1 Tax=Chaetomium strumarium TaxID=1170767 RepID=A0AAJ0H0W3_9PEZI|nr:hypothetical protein B0T15DRAFT_4160 [Chaetomium strumarium]
MNKTGNTTTAFRCELCDAPFLSRKALQQHSLAKGHPVTCYMCNDKPFPTPDALEQHCKAKGHPYCRPCNRFFARAASLRQHQTDAVAHTTRPAQPNPPSPPLSNVLREKGPFPSPLLSHARQLTDVEEGQEQYSAPFETGANIRPHALPSNQMIAQEILRQQQAAASGSSTTDAGLTNIPGFPQPPLTCRGNTYTTLSPAEQATLYTKLLAHCHTRDRLQSEGYTLDPSSAPRHLPTPPAFNPADHPAANHKAVVLDCEMVGTASGTDEVISLSLIDFFTGTPLLANVLVYPDPDPNRAGEDVMVRITDWRSDITGVTPAMLTVAKLRGEALCGGREAARAALWRYVNAETVIVGHSVNFDLAALGVVHPPGRVVDSAILTAEAYYGKKKIRGRFAGLERLCRELVGLRIRGGGNDNKNGSGSGIGGGRHDSMEDVLAAREVVIWCLRHPAELKAWAAENWREKPKSYYKAESNKNKKTRKKKNGQSTGGYKPARAARGLSSTGGSGGGWYDDEVLRWSDVVDSDTWPKSPPDWSD